MSSPPASRLGDDASDDESGASSAGPGAYGPPGRKNVGAPLEGTSPNGRGARVCTWLAQSIAKYSSIFRSAVHCGLAAPSLAIRRLNGQHLLSLV